MRMRPFFSITNRRPLPSPACVSCTGLNRPYGATNTNPGSMTLDSMRTSLCATHPWCRVVSIRTLRICCGGSILRAKTWPSAARSVSKRCQTTVSPDSFSNRILCVAGPGDTCVTISSIFSTSGERRRVISSHCGAKSWADHQVSMSPSTAKCCLQLPSETFIDPWSTTFTNTRLSCVVDIGCATL